MIKKALSSGARCILCGSAHLIEYKRYTDFTRVTSDCKMFPAGGMLVSCAACSMLQKEMDDDFKLDAEHVYQHYTIFNQTALADQIIFVGNKKKLRSEILIEHLKKKKILNPGAHLMDVGCGSGAFLRQVACLKSNIFLYGLDLDDRNLNKIKKIEGFKHFFKKKITGHIKFDVMTLIHTLEHIPNPKSFLRSLRPHLKRNGHLFVQVPNQNKNHYDVLVADHVSHFTTQTLARLLNEAGFEIVEISERWINKEISALVRPALRVSHRLKPGPVTVPADIQRVVLQLQWLDNVLEQKNSILADEQYKKSPLGIFGSSIPAVWLLGSLSSKARKRIDFFVDEDESRVARKIHGKPIYSVDQVPRNAVILLPLVPSVIKTVLEKSKRLKWPFRLVPLGYP